MAYESELKTIEQLVESNIRGLASVEKIDFYPDLDTPQLSHLVFTGEAYPELFIEFCEKDSETAKPKSFKTLNRDNFTLRFFNTVIKDSTRHNQDVEFNFKNSDYDNELYAYVNTMTKKYIDDLFLESNVNYSLEIESLSENGK